jgi:ribosome biogenesis GTPase
LTERHEGIVLRAVSGVYTVQRAETEDITSKRAGHADRREPHERDLPVIHCTLRGNLKKDLQYTTSDSFAKRVTRAKRSFVNDTISVGDRVKYVDAKQGAGVIEEVLPRRSRFSRSGFRGKEQTLVCNLDQIVIVFACAEPNPDPWKVDRFLVATESEELQPLLVANKCDLVSESEAGEMFAEWSSLGYRVIHTSVRQGIGLEELREALKSKVSAFVGPSGVGKSSLLNALQPGLNLKTADIGYVTYKGRHTTTAAQLIPMRSGGWVADTPGLRNLDLFEAERDDLPHFFPEFKPLLGHCRFDNCRHTTEPGCAIKEAVERGDISVRRYESFRILEGELEPARR